MDIQSVKKEYHLVRVVDDKGDVHSYKRFGHQKWIKRHNHHLHMWNELPKPKYDSKHSIDKLTNYDVLEKHFLKNNPEEMEKIVKERSEIHEDLFRVVRRLNKLGLVELGRKINGVNNLI
jgi:hypothetical protein